MILQIKKSYEWNHFYCTIYSVILKKMLFFKKLLLVLSVQTEYLKTQSYLDLSSDTNILFNTHLHTVYLKNG